MGTKSKADDRESDATRTDGLVVVSNRQPYSHGYENGDVAVSRPAGGLTAGLDPVMQRASGTWVAWGDGDADRLVADADGAVEVPPGDPAYTLQRVWLDEEEVEDYYYGFANRVLWPLCHGAMGNMSYEPRYWHQYERVNRKFADATVEQAAVDSTIWFQDYHFALAPEMVRDSVPTETTLAQFWHIPWPAWDTFRACPKSGALLEGLLANDLLGFHVDRYCQNFLQCVEASVLDATIDWECGRVHHEGRTTVVESFPMGVDVSRIESLAASPEAAKYWSKFCDEQNIDSDTTVAVGVDRLDYTKGIPERLRAIEYLLENYPEYREHFVYVQKGAESRSRIPAYQQLQSDVSAAISRVNDRFATDDWQPVVSLTEYLSEAELYGLFRHSDAALVSPVRDGMNLVAKEFVSAQLESEGALLLSDLAGAHEDLGEYAYSINPYDPEEFASTIHEAVTTPGPKRRERMRRQRQLVTVYDLSAWMDDFLGTVETVRERREKRDRAESEW
ncbi:alpha,alpha-trehalose-phosphate synthase (UDP-forming) [Halorussus halophilus]|uniref:alpha,alpha-trehalose-phosphate synthase (UDP-forming) n=1 Tax=Halorussus halophilus TaxID=2650975 RepID=UPI0013010D8F|nr:trehalose-6-phosphate synthase [Halorussus halophilus]